MTVRYRAQALADIDGISRYLEERSPMGARNVLRAIYAGVALIEQQPLASPRTDNPNIHAKVVRRYRYKIFYKVCGDMSVEIVHVRHTSREPWVADAWRRNFTSPPTAA